ncbi:FAD-dependent monooxygenase OpS4 [Fusarium oxysporum f. sp. albedinis]|nr:FAD-dependent monooxygenase OpS4 [Fusarium oxysporum f. sp. albedinis]
MSTSNPYSHRISCQPDRHSISSVDSQSIQDGTVGRAKPCFTNAFHAPFEAISISDRGCKGNRQVSPEWFSPC